MRVAVVEDNGMLRQILVAALEPVAGYQPTGFADPATALAACEAEVFDLVLLDHRLPGMTGIEAMRALRADPRHAHVPVIIVTGDDDQAVRLEAIRSGATDFLTKPVNIEELRLRVGNLLALRGAQREASEREALLHSVMSVASAGLAIADAASGDMRPIYSNAVFDEMSGTGCDKATGLACRLIDREHAAEADAPDFLAAVQERRAGRFRLRSRRRDGALFWNQVDLRPVPAPGPAARYLVATQTDITSEIEAQVSRDHVNARLGDIAALSGAWLFEFDRDLRLSYASPAMCDQLGIPADRMCGMDADGIGAEVLEDNDSAPRSLHRLLSERREVREVMLRFRRGDGAVRWVQLNAAPFLAADGSFGGMRGFAGDISAIVAARDAARAAERTQSTFVAMMSHELRTPLTAVVGLSEMLEDCEDPAERRANLRIIRSAAAGLTAVLGDVLDHARLAGGKVTLERSAFGVGELAEAVVGLHRVKAQAKGLALSLRQSDGAGGRRLGDPTRLRQVMTNLVSNAIKYTDAGRVEVHLDQTDPARIVFEVADTGIGLKPADIERAFAPFVQIDDGDARRSDGTGLGLAITRRLVEAMDGRIDVQSTHGAGSVFRVVMPLAEVVGGEATPAARVAARLDGVEVLVADDNKTNRMLLSAMLGKLGARVTLCVDGPSALEAWAPGRFAALLLDINMPGMAGTEVIRAIRAQEAELGLSPVRAHAVTANAHPEQAMAYREAGFDGVVTKPFGQRDLAAALAGCAGAAAEAA